MKPVYVAVAAITCALGALGSGLPIPESSGIAIAAESEPEAVIRTIYERYSPEDAPSGLEERTFSPSLLKAWNEVEETADAAGEVGVDWDVFIDAQDLDAVTDVATKFTAASPDKGTVSVTFTVFGESKTMDYAMVETTEGWKIDNISWGPDREDLRATLTTIRDSQLEAN